MLTYMRSQLGQACSVFQGLWGVGHKELLDAKVPCGGTGVKQLTKLCMQGSFPVWPLVTLSPIPLPPLPKLYCCFGSEGQTPPTGFMRPLHNQSVKCYVFTSGKVYSSPISAVNVRQSTHFSKMKTQSCLKRMRQETCRASRVAPIPDPPQAPHLETVNCAHDGLLHCCHPCQPATRCGHLSSQHGDL